MNTRFACRMFWCTVFLLGVGLLWMNNQAWAQSKTGTTIGQFLLIEPSARAAAMGNAGVAMSDEVASAYYNPAAIGQLSGYGAQFTHSLWLADISYDYAAAFIHAGNFGNLFLSVTSLSSGEIDVRTVEQPLGTGERYTVSDLALGLGYGRQLTDRFAVGLQLSYIQETIWHSSLSTFALNVGTIYRISENGLRIGASISNFGLQAGYSGRDLRIQYDRDPDKYGDNSSLPAEIFTEKFPLPVLFRVGLSWPVELARNNRVLFAVDAFHPNDNTESMSFGAEWTLFEILAMRGGYQNLFQKDSESGLTFGAGFQYDIGSSTVHFDYGWADHGRLKEAQRFSLGVRF
ncbi:MAG: PorV/PorQ family protein [candidate division KSB1 bacterium]|nr:PorV/PorQ family protein [candidate division KSB1 bacterium]MDZ7300985.1 PorV/PorQ family protein [candidate division KSB1 bacterium]MDZ7310337.1 PorV/PorQ family protein [candidate division KSB1 bacterium]